MKASELIRQLHDAVDKYGDLEVGALNQECMCYDEMGGVHGKRTAERDGAYWQKDDESLGIEFIALK